MPIFFWPFQRKQWMLERLSTATYRWGLERVSTVSTAPFLSSRWTTAALATNPPIECPTNITLFGNISPLPLLCFVRVWNESLYLSRICVSRKLGYHVTRIWEGFWVQGITLTQNRCESKPYKRTLNWQNWIQESVFLLSLTRLFFLSILMETTIMYRGSVKSSGIKRRISWAGTISFRYIQILHRYFLPWILLSSNKICITTIEAHIWHKCLTITSGYHMFHWKRSREVPFDGKVTYPMNSLHNILRVFFKNPTIHCRMLTLQVHCKPVKVVGILCINFNTGQEGCKICSLLYQSCFKRREGGMLIVVAIQWPSIVCPVWLCSYRAHLQSTKSCQKAFPKEIRGQNPKQTYEIKPDKLRMTEIHWQAFPI